MNALPLTIAEAATALRAGQYSSEQLTGQMLERIEHQDARLGAVRTVCPDSALAAARQADEELGSGRDRGPMHGIPVALKDILATVDAPTTAQSLAMLDGYEGYDSAVAANLRDAGAVLIAKASCSEFACGAPDPEKPFPFPRNPWDLDRWAGGSSGGSASGLLAGFFLGAVGTDTGGSIRVPAAFTGITGLKPTTGLVSRYGCVPLSYTMDHIGPMARSARDCALLLAAMAGGPDPRDAATVGAPQPHDYAAELTGDIEGMRIGVERAAHARAELPLALIESFERAIAELEAAGAQIVDIEVPFAAELFTATRVILNSEAVEVHRTNLRAHWTDYGRSTRTSIATGAFYTGADYARARRFLSAAREVVSEFFDLVDVVASVTCPLSAWRFEEIATITPLKVPMFTSKWNGLGVPAVSVPIGNVDVADRPGAMPVAMQLAGPRNADGTVLNVADAYQARTDWHLRVPPLFSAATLSTHQ